MPNYLWHDKKKISDFNASQFLGTNVDTFIGWEVITLFYSALHYVDSFLSNAFQVDFIPDHDTRKKYVMGLLPIVENNYRLLRHLSEDARYNAGVNNSDLVTAKNHYRFIKSKLTPVTCTACGYLNLVNKGKCEVCNVPLP
jgi:hypothetical protein